MSVTHASDQFLSSRGQVEPFHAMDVLAEANALQSSGEAIDFLCVGQPADRPPQAALDAAADFLKQGVVSYTDAGGHRDLRNRLSGHYHDRYGVSVAADRFFITTGSSAGFSLAFLSLFDVGDRFAIATPGYPAYRNILKALSLDIVEIETDAGTRWAITPDQVRAVHAKKPLKGILVASPANPSGTMMTPDALAELLECCRELGIEFISDEIYHGLTYPDETGIREATALEFSDDAIIINSFSKYFCMTGWRVGWMVLPEKLVRPVERIAQSLYISPPELSQVAALQALDGRDEMEVVRSGYAKNRALLLDRLPQLGFETILPIDGAFYAYADVSHRTNDSMEFAYRMLREAKVAATPGLDFDLARGHRFMRFSFAGNHATMVSALDRLETWLK